MPEKATRTETDLDNQSKIYETGVGTQERDRALGEVVLYPGFFKRWVYSKKVLAIGLHGLVQNDGFWYRNWLSGFRAFWDDLTGFAPAFFTNLANDINDFILRGNSVDAYVITTITIVDVTDVAASVITTPANHAYKVTMASLRNDTRGPTASLAFTPNGGTALLLNNVNAGGIAQSMVLIGGVHNLGITAVANWAGPLWMQAGDTLENSNDNHVGGDGVYRAAIIEDYTVT